MRKEWWLLLALPTLTAGSCGGTAECLEGEESVDGVCVPADSDSTDYPDDGAAGSGGGVSDEDGSGGTANEVDSFELGFEIRGVAPFAGDCDCDVDGTALVIGDDEAGLYSLEDGSLVGTALTVGGYNGQVVQFEGTTDTQIAVVLHGADGLALSTFDPAVGDFGMVVLEPGFGNVTGLHAVPESEGHIVYTSFEFAEVGLLAPVNNGLAFLAGSALPLAKFPGAVGSPVSAFAHSASGKVLVVFEGDPGAENGQLWMGDFGDTAADAVLVGEVGDSPRDVHCDGDFCAVSNFGDDTVSLIEWADHDAEPTGIETITGASGSVFVDVSKVGSEVRIATGSDQESVFLVVPFVASSDSLAFTQRSFPFAGLVETVRSVPKGQWTGAFVFGGGYRLGVTF